METIFAPATNMFIFLKEELKPHLMELKRRIAAAKEKKSSPKLEEFLKTRVLFPHFVSGLDFVDA